jgi:hypothetical protein
MLTKLFTSEATYPNNIIIPPITLRHHAYYSRFLKDNEELVNFLKKSLILYY